MCGGGFFHGAQKEIGVIRACRPLVSELVLFVHRCVVSPIATNPVSTTDNRVREPMALILPVLLAAVGSQDRRRSSLGNHLDIPRTNINSKKKKKTRYCLAAKFLRGRFDVMRAGTANKRL